MRLSRKTLGSEARFRLTQERRNLDVALKRLEERTMDPILILALGRVSNALAKSDVKAREARQGEYSDERSTR